jgi:anti-sigma B factor antagonist
MTDADAEHVAIELTDTAAGRITLTFSGELDLAAAPALRAALHDHLEDTDIVVDLSGVSFIDSTAIGVLVGAAKRAREAGHRVIVQNLQPVPSRVLTVAGVLDYLTDPD